jgi:hypothetical protein
MVYTSNQQGDSGRKIGIFDLPQPTSFLVIKNSNWNSRELGVEKLTRGLSWIHKRHTVIMKKNDLDWVTRGQIPTMDEMDGNGWETAENGHRQRKAEASPSPTVGWTGGRMERKAAGVQA